MSLKHLLALAPLMCGVLFGQSIEPLRITHGPWLQNLTQDGVTVCWTTNLPSVPGVLLAGFKPTGDSLVRNSTDGLINAGGTLHRVRISGLLPGQTYTYRTQSVELLKLRPYQVYYGDTLKGKELSFTTQYHAKKNTRFLVVNDIHTNGARLSSLLRAGKASGQDLVVFNGDIVDNFETESQLLGPIIDTSVRYFASRVPFVFVRGNHETRGFMARKLKDYLDYPDGRYYHSFDQGPVHFVVLDCGEDKPDNNRYYYGLADYDRYRLEELEWLKREVKTDAYRNSAFRVILVHMPIIPAYQFIYGHFPLLISGNRGYGPEFLARHFGPVLKEAGADLLIAGHTHRHLWLIPPFSGYSFPLLTNGVGNFVQVEADEKVLTVRVGTEKGEPVLERELKRK